MRTKTKTPAISITVCGLKKDTKLKTLRALAKRDYYYNPFDAGVVYALARLVEMYDQPAMANGILLDSGVDVRHGAEYDVEFLRRENRRLPRGRK